MKVNRDEEITKDKRCRVKGKARGEALISGVLREQQKNMFC